MYSWGVFDHFLKFETMAVKKGSERDLRKSLRPSLMKEYFPGGRGKRARRIWAGESNVFVETTDFQIWSWGLNMDHQMGLTGRQKAAERIYKPEKNTPLTTLNGRGAGAPLIQAISAGKFHSIVLMKNGELYACGLNSSGQCGTRRSDTNREPELVKVNFPQNTRVEPPFQVVTFHRSPSNLSLPQPLALITRLRWPAAATCTAGASTPAGSWALIPSLAVMPLTHLNRFLAFLLSFFCQLP